MNGSQVLAFLLCERVVLAPGVKPTLYGIFDSVQFREGNRPFLFPSKIRLANQENKPFFVFYKVRLAQPSILELKVLDPTKKQIALASDTWSGGNLVAQSFWAVALGLLAQNGTYIFELWNDAAHRLAYTELNVER